MRAVEVLDLGTVNHAEADARMRELQTARLRDDILDTLLLCDHPEVVTVGPGARRDAVVVPADYPTSDVDRGGGITWHGPGQLVLYPVFRWDLADEANVARITARLEDWVIAALERLGISAGRDPRMQGVWVDGRKVASVGLAFMRWVSRHGVSINLDTPAGRVEGLDGCGLSPGTTTCLSALGQSVYRFQMVEALLQSMASVLKRQQANP